MQQKSYVSDKIHQQTSIIPPVRRQDSAVSLGLVAAY